MEKLRVAGAIPPKLPNPILFADQLVRRKRLNIGNLEDQYTAQVVATTGPITANLRGLDGQPTQSIPLFILPGLSTGAILLDSVLTAHGSGTVILEVRSLTDSSIVVHAVANVSTSQVTTTTVTSSHSSGSIYGQAVTFTATVSASSGTFPDR
jgi:hypothetical protein